MGGWKCCRELGESSGENHGGQNTRVYYCGLCITLQRSISSLPPWNMLLVSYLSHSIIIIYLQYFPVLWASPVAQLQCGSESACSAGDLGSIPGLGRSLGAGKGCPLQYSGLYHGLYPWGHKESDPAERLSVTQSLPVLYSFFNPQGQAQRLAQSRYLNNEL